MSFMTVHVACKSHEEAMLQVCFGCSLHDVALYRFTGLHECSQSECDAPPAIRHNVHFSRCADAIICSAQFCYHLHSISCTEQGNAHQPDDMRRFFSLAYREVVSQGNELLKKDFCLVNLCFHPAVWLGWSWP